MVMAIEKLKRENSEAGGNIGKTNGLIYRYS
jgi:hypothetical protein